MAATTLVSELHREKRIRLGLPIYSLGEEICNALSHGVGVLMGIASWFCCSFLDVMTR